MLDDAGLKEFLLLDRCFGLSAERDLLSDQVDYHPIHIKACDLRIAQKAHPPLPHRL